MKNIFSEFTADIEAYSNVKIFIKEKLNIDWLWPMQRKVIYVYYSSKYAYQDMVLVIGMRGGKTTIASICACYEAFKLISIGTPMKKYGLPPGSQIFIINVATSAPQAKDTVFAAIKARIDNSPWFQEQKYTEHWNEFIFPVMDGTVIIRSEHSNSASLAGKTIICCIFDELARFKDTKGNSSGELVYDTLSRSVKTFKQDGRRIAISSPMLVDDFHMQLYRAGKDNPKKVYTRQMPTWEMNPTIPYESLADEFARNPETAMRDFGAIPSSALEAYFKEPQKIDMCEHETLINAFKIDETGFSIELNPEWTHDERTRYVLAGDPSFKNDAFGMGLAHKEGKQYTIDGVGRFLPNTEYGNHEIDAEKVGKLIMDIKEDCWLSDFVSDTWMFPETQQRIRRLGVNTENNVVQKEEYDFFKETIYNNAVEWPLSEILMQELKSLELVRGQKVDHPKKGSKDVSDACTNAIWKLGQSGGSGDFSVVIV